jgi:acetyl-CoA acetyltransferase
MSDRSITGKAAVVGVGESIYYKHGKSPDPEFVLAIKAILAAAEHAGVDPKSIDGFVSFAEERNTALRVAAALGSREMRWSTMQWGGGGSGGSGAVQQAAAAIAAGFTDTVAVYRAVAQGQFRRFGQSGERAAGDSHRVAYGMTTPGQAYASRVTRFLHETGVSIDTLRAVSLASYRHAQSNPRAIMYGRPLTEERYNEARWIVEPFRLFDCCQESDGAAALILTSGERARELTANPAYVLAAAQGGGMRSGGFMEGVFDSPKFATSEFEPLAARIFPTAGIKPGDVDVVQSYENFTGGVVMALIENGFCSIDEANDFITVENLTAPTGRLPLNTSGGNLAEAYIHGLELHVEAVRQLRGESVNQISNARVSFVSSGPMVTPASSILYGSEEALS